MQRTALRAAADAERQASHPPPMLRRIFLDSEWTAVPWSRSAELLWIGLANEDGRSWCAPSSEARVDPCNKMYVSDLLQLITPECMPSGIASSFVSSVLRTPAVTPNPSFNPHPPRQAPQGRAAALGASSKPGLTAPASAVGVNSKVARSVRTQMHATLRKLQGGDRRSIGRLSEVVSEVLAKLQGTSVMPDHSLEPTRTGMALGPLPGLVHHPSSGPSATPALAPQLKR
jgi:hypothetical protein